jgi:D-alanyl-lipoteichoic acid acyltransferase DltB (MBOAT superfamily)
MAFVPAYLLILLFTIAVDYTAGILIENASGKSRKLFLWASIGANVGVLSFFKYYAFFNHQLTDFLNVFAIDNPIPFLNILLPIGLSFHTFQAMSYTIEVYRGHQKAERHAGIFALYVMYYPQLVAGPIERPQNLLHQFFEVKKFSPVAFKAGLWLMIWGLFKKVVIADRIALMVDYAYANHESINSISSLLSSIFYSFQIYCDFSGYSDIAIGASGIMGIKLMTNFNFPYFSQSVTEFWRRWHISLSSWFRDYVYVPMGGNANSKMLATARNLLIVFVISGLWHGAAWTFIFWGLIHGIVVIMEKVLGIGKRKYMGGYKKILAVTFTFTIVSFAWVFFRSPNPQVAVNMIKSFKRFSFSEPVQLGLHTNEVLFTVGLVIFLLLMEKKFMKFLPKTNLHYLAGMLLMVLVCYFFGVFNQQQFIYFQF